MSGPISRGHVASLRKQNSWSPDIIRDEAWAARKRNNRLRRGRSVTDDDLDELRACFDLGFNFDSPEVDRKLTGTFPALAFYYAVNRSSLGGGLSRSSSDSLSDYDASSTPGASYIGDGGGGDHNKYSLIDPGEDPEMVRTRLRQWAQVVACSVRQPSPNLLCK